MGVRVACLATVVFLAGCAGADTVVHVSAPHDARWEVRDASGERLCALPCSVELDDDETVSIARAGGGTRFLVRQRDLGEGDFSASVRVERRHTRGALAARAFAAALAGAGSVLVESEERGEVAAGLFLSGMGAVARIASDEALAEHEELWVERTSAH